MSFLLLVYMCICTFYTVFKMRAFGLILLTPHHCTDKHSLLFNAIVFSRLTIAICLNYLYMVQMVELPQRERIVHSRTSLAAVSANTEVSSSYIV